MFRRFKIRFRFHDRKSEHSGEVRINSGSIPVTYWSWQSTPMRQHIPQNIIQLATGVHKKWQRNLGKCLNRRIGVDECVIELVQLPDRAIYKRCVSRSVKVGLFFSNLFWFKAFIACASSGASISLLIHEQRSVRKATLLYSPPNYRILPAGTSATRGKTEETPSLMLQSGENLHGYICIARQEASKKKKIPNDWDVGKKSFRYETRERRRAVCLQRLSAKDTYLNVS